ncbi:hypothetical protein E1301_Tti010652 [Triplophysa tibetana]|uniref:Uncharacterized protein n=1 Tax=Triplophysa tibetana TaxID=1572043 RepID=A0A5A9PT70_9TELE|nr:hypothetical protein E1301_Tti010652 [Triplophysa tibetana]
MILTLPLPGRFSTPGPSKWSVPLGILTSRPRFQESGAPVKRSLAQKRAGWDDHMDRLVWLVCLGWMEVLTALPREEEGPRLLVWYQSNAKTDPETKPGNGPCKTGSIALFGNVVYSGLLNDHFWHFGVPLVTRLGRSSSECLTRTHGTLGMPGKIVQIVLKNKWRDGKSSNSPQRCPRQPPQHQQQRGEEKLSSPLPSLSYSDADAAPWLNQCLKCQWTPFPAEQHRLSEAMQETAAKHLLGCLQ